MSTVGSVNGSDGAVDSRLQCGKRRGNHALSTDSNSLGMNGLREFGDSRCLDASSYLTNVWIHRSGPGHLGFAGLRRGCNVGPALSASGRGVAIFQ